MVNMTTKASGSMLDRSKKRKKKAVFMLKILLASISFVVLCLYSNMTMDTASLRILSPKMTEYNLGSTLSWLKIAKMVTGSVADKTEPKIMESRKLSWSDSSPVRDNRYTMILC
jgi:hypothetical protein